MPLTIPPIPNAAPFAAFSDNVGIFSNSKARDIPARLNAIAQALKDHINKLWLPTATGFINGTVVAGLNAAIAKMETFSNGIETRINDQMAEFQANLANYLGTNAGYSVSAANAALFTGSIVAGDVQYDIAGRAISIRQGPRLISGITYTDDGAVAGYAEELTLGGITYSRAYTFTYTPDGQLTAVTEA